MTLKKPLRLAGALVLSLIATAISVPATSAAELDPYFQRCLDLAGANGCTATELLDVHGMSALSPDGKHLYVAVLEGDGNRRGDGIVQLDFDASTGKLTRPTGTAGCVTDNGSPSTAGDISTNRCVVGRAMGTQGVFNPANAITIDPSGKNLYYTSNVGLAVFDISPTTGTLTQKPGAAGCVKADASEGCTPFGGVFANPSAMTISPNGAHAYVRVANGVAILNRADNGTLTDSTAHCVHEEAVAGCTNLAGLSNQFGDFLSRQMAISADGQHLYVPNKHYQVTGGCGFICVYNNHGFAVLTRAGDGSLTQSDPLAGGCVTSNGQSGNGYEPECQDGFDSLYNVSTALISPDGRHVYIGGGTGVSGFHRQSDGRLGNAPGAANGLPFTCVTEAAVAGCFDGSAVADPLNLDLSPDGKNIAVGGVANAIGMLLRNPDTGAITQQAGTKRCLTATGNSGECETVPALGAAAAVRFHPGGLYFLATGATTDSVSVLDRDFAPVCRPKTLGVAFNTSLPVALDCTDANGDALTFSIVKQPVNGTLAGIDQAAGTVRYSPALGFAGTDSFDYRATARGVESAPVTVTLEIAAPPVDNDKDGVSPPADCDDNNAAARPGAIEVPGNAVDEDCVGGPAALPPGRIRAGVDYFFDARNLRFTKVGKLDVTGIIAGATVQVTCKTKKKGCKFTRKRRTFSKATSKFSVKRYFNFTKKVKKGKKTRKRKIVSKLKKGTIIEIRVTAPNMIGMVVTFTTRRGKTPTFTVKCLPLGATKPQATC